MVEEEARHAISGEYKLPLTIDIQGDDWMMFGPESMLKSIVEDHMPVFFVQNPGIDHGYGSIIRDIVIGPISEHHFLSKYFVVYDNKINVIPDLRKIIVNTQYFQGAEQQIYAYPGIKTLSLYLQFGGLNPVFDALCLIAAQSLGLPGDVDKAKEMAEDLNARSDRRFLGTVSPVHPSL